jgi:AraC family transcriptional regulator of adaptative response / DNA-3-methyladenine glycosylase II
MTDVERLDVQALQQIANGAISKGGVSSVANSLHITTRHLSRIIKAKTGSSPTLLDRKRRLYDANILLQKSKMPIIAIAFSCEFGSLRQFNEHFKATYKMTPSQARKNYKLDAKKVKRI